MKKKILVAIPAFNEEKDLHKVIPYINKTTLGLQTEILVVDDGSTDKTCEKAKELGADYVLQHEYNKGVGAGFSTALDFFRNSDHDFLITIDADGQFSALDIELLLEPLINHKADLAIASRFEGKEPINMPKHKYYLNKVISGLVQRLMGKKVSDLTCGFRAYTKQLCNSLSLFSPYTYTQEVIIDTLSKNFRIARIPIEVHYFQDRKSRVVSSVFSYMKKSIIIIIRTVRDARPLLFFGLPGIITMILGVIFAGVFIYKYLHTLQTTPNRTWFFISGFLLITGLLMVFMGLMSDMLKRNRKISEDIMYEIRKYGIGKK